MAQFNGALDIFGPYHDLDDPIHELIGRLPSAEADRLRGLLRERSLFETEYFLEGIVAHLPAFGPTLRALADHVIGDGQVPRCCGIARPDPAA